MEFLLAILVTLHMYLSTKLIDYSLLLDTFGNSAVSLHGSNCLVFISHLFISLRLCRPQARLKSDSNVTRIASQQSDKHLA
jgi:hypothetical protein